MDFFIEPRSRLGASSSDQIPSAAIVQSVPVERWEEFIRWVDPLKDASEVNATLRDFKRRSQTQPSSPLPLETTIDRERIAGAYMMLLGARVAAVAGVRTVDTYPLSAVDLLNRLVSEARAHGCVQIQAILDGTDLVANEVVQRAGFVPMAELQQLVLTMTRSQSAVVSSMAGELPEQMRWVSASSVPREKVTTLLSETFIETLDCPALNGMRTADDVLAGFLDGQQLTQQKLWSLLEKQGKLIGCVLVNTLPNGAAELVYMGLAPASRGRGYGRLLLQRAIRVARTSGSEMFLAAVDCANRPAIRLYLQAGFQEHARVQAWFHLQDK